MPTNTLQKVVTYTDAMMPYLDANLTYCSLANTTFKEWNMPKNRGDLVSFRVPSNVLATDSLSWNPATAGSFSEKIEYLQVNKEHTIPLGWTDQDWAEYDLEQTKEMLGKSAVQELSAEVDGFVAEVACFGANRWLGQLNPADANKPTGTSLLTNELIHNAMSKFRDYGGQTSAQCVLPTSASTLIANSGFSQFLPETNEKRQANPWKLGSMAGLINTNFYISQYNPTHIAGTVAEEGEATITSVSTTTYTEYGKTVAASEIVLSGLTDGKTIVANDMGDIGATLPTDFIKFVRPSGHKLTDTDVQFRVVEGGTVSSGSVTIKVTPALISDTTNPDYNLSRPINPATDKLRIVGDHKCGVVFLNPALYFACPKLGSKSPYASNVVQSPKTKISFRGYYGSIFNEPDTFMVHDIIYGAKMVGAYAARLIFPINPSNY